MLLPPQRAGRALITRSVDMTSLQWAMVTRQKDVELLRPFLAQASMTLAHCGVLELGWVWCPAWEDHEGGKAHFDAGRELDGL